MSDGIIVAIIAACVSVLSLIWNFSTVRKTRSILLAVEDAAKRSDIVRSQGLKAVEETLTALSDMHYGVSDLNFLQEHGHNLAADSPDFLKMAGAIGTARSQLQKTRFIASPYLSDELVIQIEQILRRTKIMQSKETPAIEAAILECINNVAKQARDSYLS